MRKIKLFSQNSTGIITTGGYKITMEDMEEIIDKFTRELDEKTFNELLKKEFPILKN